MSDLLEAAETPSAEPADGAATAAATDAAADAGKPEAKASDAGILGGEEPASNEQQPGETLAEWRVRMANGDEAELKRLNRFASEANVWKSFREMERKLSSGAIVKLGDDGKPTDVEAFRKALGVPEKIEEYVIKTPANRELSELDKPVLEDFRAHAHALSVPPGMAAGLVDWYLNQTDRAKQVMQEHAFVKRQEYEDELRVEWGPEYRQNITLANTFIETQAPELKGLLGAVMADGTRLGDNPNLIRFVVGQARSTMGDTYMADLAQGQANGKSIDEQIADWNALRFSENPAESKRYWQAVEDGTLNKLYARKEKRGAA